MDVGFVEAGWDLVHFVKPGLDVGGWIGGEVFFVVEVVFPSIGERGIPFAGAVLPESIPTYLFIPI